jgi:hypothetical protein
VSQPSLRGGEPVPRQLRVVGPDTLQRANRNLVYVEGLYDGKNWKAVPPDQLSVKVTGAARLLDDPAGKPTNPFEVRGEDVPKGQAVVEARAGDLAALRKFAVGATKPAGTFEGTVSPDAVSHRFMGLGGGVLFYDNQFDITAKDDLYDWCFRDVRTSFLHVLIRSDYENENDNDDWRVLDLTKFDFRSLERPLRIMKKALERNPDLKVYASLYSPPAWMKTNQSTAGKGTLKAGLRFRQELAEYVFAYLKRLHREKVTVHYLGWFNEPDFPHTQEGMYMPDFGELADTFHDCTQALDTLIAADPELKGQPPVYVFPDVLGAGAITRDAKNVAQLKARPAALNRVGVWGVHDYWNQAGTYWGQRYHELRAFPGVGARPIWMTEWAQRDRLGDLASGVAYGAQILGALRAGAEAWMVFEWCHPSGNQAGLISTDWGAKAPRERYWRSKAYHVFRQVANTTPAGAQVLTMTGRWEGASQGKGSGVEYLALRDGAKVVIHLMNTEPAPVTFRVSGRGLPEKVAGWQTTPLADMEEVTPGDLKTGRQGEIGTVRGVVPGNSLLSMVLDGMSAKKAPGE